MFGFVILLLTIGVVMMLVPIDAQVKRLLMIVLTIMVVLWLLSLVFGFGGNWSRGGIF